MFEKLLEPIFLYIFFLPFLTLSYIYFFADWIFAVRIKYVCATTHFTHVTTSHLVESYDKRLLA